MYIMRTWAKNPRELYLIRDIILKRNRFITYQDFLSSDYWKAIKEKVKGPKHSDNYNSCQMCKREDDIHLHHETYRWMLTRYELRDIISLCSRCHKAVHDTAYEEAITFKQAKDLVLINRATKLYYDK